MSDEMGPLGIDPTQTATEPAAPAARMPLDTTSRMIVGAGVATAVIALIGGLMGAWRMDWLGIVLIMAGLAAAGIAWLDATDAMRIDALPGRDIELAAGVVAGVLSVLNVFELLFDLDQLDERGGIVGAVLTVALAVGGLALLAGVVRRWTSPRDIVSGGDRGTRIAYAGVGLAVLGWLGNVTIGVWNFSAGVGVLTVLIVAGIVLLWASDPTSKRLPIAGAWIAVVLSAVAAVLGLQHLIGFLDLGSETDLGLTYWLPFLLYVAGVAMALVGSVWTAYERTMEAQERSSVGTPDVF